MIHSIVNVYADCSFPKAFSLSYLIYGIIITALFLNFYFQSYNDKKTSKSANGAATRNGISKKSD